MPFLAAALAAELGLIGGEVLNKRHQEVRLLRHAGGPGTLGSLRGVAGLAVRRARPGDLGEPISLRCRCHLTPGEAGCGAVAMAPGRLVARGPGASPVFVKWNSAVNTFTLPALPVEVH